jgi:hypothetical protein
MKRVKKPTIKETENGCFITSGDMEVCVALWPKNQAVGVWISKPDKSARVRFDYNMKDKTLQLHVFKRKKGE